MVKRKIVNLFGGAKVILSRHAPEILTGIGIAGMVTTTILSVKATPKALVLIERAREEKGEELTVREKIKAGWKCYIPAATTGILSTACIIGAGSANARRNAALATAYKISETAFTEYKDKVAEVIGEKKEKNVRDEIAKDRLENNPVVTSEVIITEKGNTLCFDPISGRHFKSDIERIKKAQNELNKRMIQDLGGYISLNEFYDELELDHISVGDDLGWNLDKGLIEIEFSSHINNNGEPSIVLDYVVAPKYDYSSRY